MKYDHCPPFRGEEMRLGDVQFPKVYSWNMTDPGLNFRSAVLSFIHVMAFY